MISFTQNNSLLISSKKEAPDFPHNPNNLVLVFDTSKEPENNTISVPINGTVNCTINWGDGTSENHTAIGFKTHTYDTPGIYVVQISGTMTSLNYGTGGSKTNNKLKLVRCLSFGNVGLTSLQSAFLNCSNFIQCPNSLPITSNVINLQSTFFGCSQFNDINVTLWNTSAITNMSNMFRECSSFNQNISNWNIANVTNMSSMFFNCFQFNQPVESWNVSQVINMNNLFYGCNKFNQNIGSWNTANVTNIAQMFHGCVAFNQNISSWDIRKVTTMFNMFTSANNWGTSNYDAALISWSQQTSPRTSVPFGVGTNKYSLSAQNARNILTGTYNWTINDGGVQ